MNKIKIGLTGVHGAGITTKAMELSDHYADLGNMVFVVDEVARSCPHTLRTIEWLQADDPIRPKDVAYACRIDALFDRFVQPYVTKGC